MVSDVRCVMIQARQKAEPVSDRSWLSYTLTLSILTVSVVSYAIFHEGGSYDADQMYGSGTFSTVALMLFRFGCAYLVIHSAVVWMVRNPTPGVMSPLFRADREMRLHHSTGFERLVPFSSWTMLMFGFAMLWNGLGSLWHVLVGEPSNLVLHLGTAFFATAFSSAALTSIIVRYVIIPAQMKQGEDLYHMFLPHEQVMHNWALVFLSCELVLGTHSIRLSMVVLGLTYGALYLIFAELWARFGGGYYVYDFIDPRPKEGPIYLVGLMLICSLSFLLGFGVSQIQQSYPLVALALVGALVGLSTRFGPPKGYEPRMTQDGPVMSSGRTQASNSSLVK